MEAIPQSQYEPAARTRRFHRMAVLGVCLMVLAGASQAASRTCTEASTVSERSPPVINVRIDNDLFARQDQGYSSGILVSLVSPNLKDYTEDDCLPGLARWINRHLARIQPSGFDQQNMVVKVGQGIFTPNDPEPRELIADDRPYAGALLASFGYNARKGDRLRSTQLVFGIVGPDAYAKQSQDFIHRLIGSKRFNGWDNQLHNEPVAMLVHERSRRYATHAIGSRGLQWDAINHWGGAIGNFQTYASAGTELRLGFRLPNDFGSSPVRPAGDNTAPNESYRVMRGWTWHAFVATDAKWVLHDITLDGNTFRDSHSVDKKPFVGEAAIGMAATYDRWKFAFARYYRTREFDGQRSRPSFGSFTISRAF